VTSEEPDKTLALLDTLEDPKSPIRAVVSVSMLKEGWDVKNIYVISSVRAMESQLLTEQILGRGLRLPFGERTGNPMLDTVEVLSHHSFKNLLKGAKRLLEETIGDRLDEASVVLNPVAGKHSTGTALSDQGELPLTLDTGDTESVEFRLPGAAAGDANQLGLFGEEELGHSDAEQAHVGLTLATMDSRVAAADSSTTILNRILVPRAPGGLRIPLYLPQVVTKWVRDPFSLTQINLTNVEALGRQFAEDNAPTLVRKALDAHHDEHGKTHIVITDQSEQITASQTRLPFDNIETDLVQRLLATNAVEATITEANAALGVAKAFLQGADVTIETPWRAEHGRLATAKLTEWISAQQTSSPAREVREVQHVRWPDPSERHETRPPADRHIVTERADFERWYPYTGYERSVYEVNSFDAYSTEFLLAALFEQTPGVKAWVRIDQTVPMRITYLVGAIQKAYEPDFIVIDTQGTYWVVEGKADGEMTSPVVLAKRDAARAWVSTVNASGNVQTKWGYLLASESVIKNASTWEALRNGGQAFQ